MEIAIASFKHAVGKVGLEVRNRTRVIDNSVDKLKAVVYFYKERVLNPPVQGGCPILNSSIEADDNHPHLKEQVIEAINYWHAGIVKTLKRGVERNEIKIETNPEDFATFFIGTLEGGIMLSRIYKDVDRFGVMASQLLRAIDKII